jgi:hypothetical protein
MSQQVFHIVRPSVAYPVLTTTDATTTTLTSYTLPDEATAWIESTIILRNDSDNSGATIKVGATVSRNGGSATLQGSVQTILAISGAAGLLTATATIDTSSNDFRIRVTGIAATDIVWQHETKVIIN